jgi:hypothetical protein
LKTSNELPSSSTQFLLQKPFNQPGSFTVFRPFSSLSLCFKNPETSMKKTIQKIMILSFCVGVGLTLSCKKDALTNPANCSKDADKVTNAAIAYGNNQT